MLKIFLIFFFSDFRAYSENLRASKTLLLYKCALKNKRITVSDKCKRYNKFEREFYDKTSTITVIISSSFGVGEIAVVRNNINTTPGYNGNTFSLCPIKTLKLLSQYFCTHISAL